MTDMSLHENVTDEEQSILDILIDQDIQSESAGSHCSQKRKAADDVYDSNSEQRVRVCTYVYVLYMAICLGICFSNKKHLILSKLVKFVTFLTCICF
jgi:hypothetical protein